MQCHFRATQPCTFFSKKEDCQRCVKMFILKNKYSTKHGKRVLFGLQFKGLLPTCVKHELGRQNSSAPQNIHWKQSRQD